MTELETTETIKTTKTTKMTSTKRASMMVKTSMKKKKKAKKLGKVYPTTRQYLRKMIQTQKAMIQTHKKQLVPELVFLSRN